MPRNAQPGSQLIPTSTASPTEAEDNRTRLQELAMAILEENFEDALRQLGIQAGDGNMRAIDLLLNRLLGPVPSRTELTGKDGAPIQVVAWAPSAAMQSVLEGTAMQDIAHRAKLAGAVVEPVVEPVDG